ncbi:MAG TPA: demethoxyubiquinone hydroxylase family protein [Verrucomicrobiae bacterium]|nr:demethoxyubiquinone hydroxylase family protein [Verrucomicrobiae bacterium]
MPEFTSPFSALVPGRKMTMEELRRAVRFGIAAEYEAVQIYQQIAETTDDPLVKKVMTDVANEELEHVGEFLELLRQIAPEEEGFYRHGAEEVREMMEAPH